MLVKKVKEFLKANNLINEDYAIVAVSTGVDSTVLLDILYKIAITTFIPILYKISRSTVESTPVDTATIA